MYNPYDSIPPPPPARRTFWRDVRRLHPLLQLALAALTLLVSLFVGVACSIWTPAFMGGIHNAQATQTATHSANYHGRPHMGGILDDFVAAYGLATKTAPDNETFTSDNVQITAYVYKAQVVNQIYIVGPSSWNLYTTLTYCKQFLPPDAVALTNAVGDRIWVDYSSSLGKVVMQLQVPTCLLFIAPS